MVERRQQSDFQPAENKGGRSPRSKNPPLQGCLLALGLFGLFQMGGKALAVTAPVTTPSTGPSQILTASPLIAGSSATSTTTSLPANVTLPAATSVAVGPNSLNAVTGVTTGYVIEMTGNGTGASGTQSTLSIYNKNGTIATNNTGRPLTFSLQNWFNPTNNMGITRLGVFAPTGQIFDPHVIYDQYRGRWITTALAGLPGQGSVLLIGVSASSDPTNQNTWQYSTADMSVDFDQNFGRSGNSWNDFDQIGINNDGVYVTANEYSFTSSDPTKPPITISNISFAHAKLRVFDTTTLFATRLSQNLDGTTFTAATPPVKVLGIPSYIDFTNFQDTNTFAQSINLQPCHTYGTMAADGSALPEYIVSAVQPNNSTGGTTGTTGGTTGSGNPGQIRVFSFTPATTVIFLTPASVTQGPTVVTTPFSDPPNAMQPVTTTNGTNTPAVLAVGDSRLLSAVYRNGFIWTAGSTATTNSTGAAIAAVHWVKIDTALFPVPNSPGFVVAPASDNVLTPLNGDSIYLPSITSDISNTTYICYNRSGAALFPTLEAIAIPASANSSSTVVRIRKGATPWQCAQPYGIYNGVSTDPSDDTAVWVAGEYGGDNVFGNTSDCTAQTEIARIRTGPSPYIANFLAGNGLTETAATSISGNQVVGYAYGTATGNVIHAIGWAGLQSLGIDLTPTPTVLPGASAPVGVNIGQSFAYSGSGLSIGGSFTPAGSAAGTLHAGLFTAPPVGSSIVTSLPADLNPNGFLTSSVNAVSGGQQVGYGRMIGGDFRALLWSGRKESAFDLTPAGAARAFALGISSGVEAGAIVTPAGIVHPVLWPGATKLPVDLLPTGFIAGYAMATDGPITMSNQVGFGYQSGTGTLHALLWLGTAASVKDLHPGTFGYSVADAVAAGHQVGYGTSSDSGNPLHALVWSGSSNSVFDLHTTLGSGFVASYAAGIDSTGRIVGTAITTSGLHVAVVWVPQLTGP